MKFLTKDKKIMLDFDKIESFLFNENKVLYVRFLNRQVAFQDEVAKEIHEALVPHFEGKMRCVDGSWRMKP